MRVTPRGFRVAPMIGVAIFIATSAVGETTIQPLTPIIEGHSVGGVAIDLIGNLYVADFGETVWKITPEGIRTEFATGLYGASGNAIDGRGNLLQANCYGNSIVRISRTGQAQEVVSEGLSCPVGLAIRPGSNELYVANCKANNVSKVLPDGTVSIFATSAEFKCPNGLTFGNDGTLYVANFRDNRILKVSPSGSVARFAAVSGKGLGHLCSKGDRLYVTAYGSHEVYEVASGGTSRRVIGDGTQGLVNGTADRARLSFPNGIACDPWTPRLYINEYLNESATALPRRSIVRRIELDVGNKGTAH
jgi:DNA-binding beta-propeller fold protein YncE